MYPDSIYDPRARANKQGFLYDADDATRLFAEDVDGWDDEIKALENTLGLNPQGLFPTVADRLNSAGANGLFTRKFEANLEAIAGWYNGGTTELTALGLATITAEESGEQYSYLAGELISIADIAIPSIGYTFSTTLSVLLSDASRVRVGNYAFGDDPVLFGVYFEFRDYKLYAGVNFDGENDEILLLDTFTLESALNVGFVVSDDGQFDFYVDGVLKGTISDRTDVSILPAYANYECWADVVGEQAVCYLNNLSVTIPLPVTE